MAQLIKNLPAMWETWVQSLGWEDPLRKGTDTHSSSLAHAARRAPVWGDAPRCWVTLGVRGSDITPRMRKLPSSGKPGREAEKVSTKTLFASLIFPPPRPRPSWPRPRARRLVGIVVPGPLSPPQEGRRGLRRSKPRNWTAEGAARLPGLLRQLSERGGTPRASETRRCGRRGRCPLPPDLPSSQSRLLL